VTICTQQAAEGVEGDLRIRAFEKRVLRRIFGTNSGEATEVWRKLNNATVLVLNFRSSLNIVTH
jgi:hypothetical protein